jgi:hypothetical protein
MNQYTNNGKVEVLFDPESVATQQARDIMSRLVPEWAVGFISKNRKYKAVGNDLGPRGIFPDVNRKTGILKDRIWDGNGVVGEATREVIQDLIGHLFLMLHMMDGEAERDAEQDAADLAEGQGMALDRAADRMSSAVAEEVNLAKYRLLDDLKNAIADAQRGHRPSEWERVAQTLAAAANVYLGHTLPAATRTTSDARGARF